MQEMWSTDIEPLQLKNQSKKRNQILHETAARPPI